jgi:hypothetical protein
MKQSPIQLGEFAPKAWPFDNRLAKCGRRAFKATPKGVLSANSLYNAAT